MFYCGAVSLRRPKLTSRRKSENTSRFGVGSPKPDLDASEPVGGPLAGGGVKVPKILSEALELLWVAARRDGRLARLADGLVTPVKDPLAGGSMSKVVKKEVACKSSLVLVIETKVSKRLFCSARGVPFKSRTYIEFWISRTTL